MLAMYPACFMKSEKSYCVLFPDLNDLATDGKDMNQAMEMAIDCLAGYLFTAKRDHEKINKPSKYNEIDIERIVKEYEIDRKDVLVLMVTVDVDEYAKKHFCKSVKKTLTIPDWLNKEAMKKHINFSKALQDALITLINE